MKQSYEIRLNDRGAGRTRVRLWAGDDWKGHDDIAILTIGSGPLEVKVPINDDDLYALSAFFGGIAADDLVLKAGLPQEEAA